MTPQEKAEELVDKFYPIFTNSVRDTLAKQCALKAVDEIIESRKDDGRFDDRLLSTSSEYYTPHPMYLTYWLQVKQELEKL
jgi:hypothetical protein